MVFSAEELERVIASSRGLPGVIINKEPRSLLSRYSESAENVVLQGMVDSLTDFDNDCVDEAYFKQLARELGVQSITIVSLSLTKGYQVEFYTSDSRNATITTKNMFSRDLYVGQKIAAS